MRFILIVILTYLLVSCGEITTTNTNTPGAIAPNKEGTTSTLAPQPHSSTTTKNVGSAPVVAPKWLCIPGKQVGLIKNTSTEADIIKAYGKSNVIRRTIGLGEGETTDGTVVFPDTDNEVTIEWAKDKAFQKPAKVRIEKANTAWKTDQGIGVGTTLAQLEAINGKDFKFAGFEWDYAGIANNWQGGNIDKRLTVFLEANNPKALYPDLIGDSLFDASNPKAKAADLRVRTLIIGLD